MENIKKYIRQFVIKDLADLIIKYYGSYVEIFDLGFDITGEYGQKCYFLKTNSIGIYIIDNVKNIVRMSVNKNIGIHYNKGLEAINNIINELPTDQYIFYLNIRLDDEEYLITEWKGDYMSFLLKNKRVGPYIKEIRNKGEYKYEFYNYGKCLYSVILNEKQYEQFINDYISISYVMFECMDN
jgi:hypothetical protein